LVQLYRAFTFLPENQAEAVAAIQKAGTLSKNNNFPLRVEELAMFEELLKAQPEDANLHYFYGNLLYYLGQKEKGLAEWHKAVDMDPNNAFACRNVGFGEGQIGNYDASMKYYDMAIKANPNDALLMTESDKIFEKAGAPIETRLKRMEKNLKTVMKHDDAVMRLLSIYNETGKYDQAAKIMENRHFHLWEGGGEIHTIYVNSHMLNGMTMLKKKNYQKAINELDLAMQYPTNLEVAPSANGGYGAKAYYLQGIAYEGMGKADLAKEAFEKSANSRVRGTTDLSYYQVKAMRKLGKTAEAEAALKQMVTARDNMQKNLVDNYAKFGESNRNVQESSMNYFSGLVEDLLGNEAAAKQAFNKAATLNPGNIWAKWMNKEKAF
jgi:tetratricopeptide (TPR) repeat protein